MPKVSSFTVRIDGKPRHIDVHYTKKECFNIPKIPDELYGVYRSGEVKMYNHETEKKLREAFENLVATYHALKASARKVIAYSLKVSMELTYDLRNSDEHSKSWRQKDSVPDNLKQTIGHFDSGEAGLYFAWRVLYEKNNNGIRYYEYNDDGTIGYNVNLQSSDFGRAGENVIEWTQEREDFFKDMKKALDKLGQRFIDFFGQDTETLLLRMDNHVPGQKLLTSKID